MDIAFKLDPRLLISPPFTTCPSCGAQEFGILAVHEASFVRRCGACSQNETYSLPPVRKTIIYIDQFVVSGFMRVRQNIAKPGDGFYITLYEKFARLLRLQAIVCPFSEAHLLESEVHSDPRAMRSSYRAFAAGVSFKGFDDIRYVQVMARLERWLMHDATRILINRAEVFRGQPVDVWTKPFDTDVELPSIPGITEKIRAWRAQSHQGLLQVFTNTWKVEPHQTWEYWRDREAGSWGRLIFPIYKREVLRWANILEGKVQPLPRETEPHHFVTLINDIADRIEEAGCPPAQKLETALRFLKEATGDTPFRQIAGSIYACIGKKAAAQSKLPTQGFHNDVDVMSCILPYCNAMFVDREIAAYWREIQGTPSRRLPFETKVFSMATKAEFLSYLDQIEQSVPEMQSKGSSECYPPA